MTFDGESIIAIFVLAHILNLSLRNSFPQHQKICPAKVISI
ncbi:hypothetical protein M214_1545 [Acinetobacter baumannii CI86]|nr:hypothetical protein M214_1545 [Acinetobacter baumannii CI86]ETR88887.1 hypothetical protein M212_1591 [Acinetobacter baumannii CI79]